MTKREEIIAQVLEASGGRIVGRIRLQKMVYLLQQLGSGTDFKFSYHHYGPYAEEVSISIQRAIKIEKSITEKEVPYSQGGFYSEFELLNQPKTDFVGQLPLDVARNYTSLMKAETSLVLELAATVHWLRNKEKITNWNEELKLRKPGKATAENTTRAVNLLAQLNLAA